MPLPAQRPAPTRPRPPTPARDLGPSPALGSTQTKQLQAQVRKVLPPGRTLQSYGLSLLTKDPKVSTGGRKPRAPAKPSSAGAAAAGPAQAGVTEEGTAAAAAAAAGTAPIAEGRTGPGTCG